MSRLASEFFPFASQGKNTAPAREAGAFGLRVAGAVFPAPVASVSVSEATAMLLRLVACHDGCSESDLVARLVAERGLAIGMNVLLVDDEFEEHCVGGAAVARRSHKPEVPGSNPGPATSCENDLTAVSAGSHDPP